MPLLRPWRRRNGSTHRERWAPPLRVGKNFPISRARHPRRGGSTLSMVKAFDLHIRGSEVSFLGCCSLQHKNQRRLIELKSHGCCYLRFQRSFAVLALNLLHFRTSALVPRGIIGSRNRHERSPLGARAATRNTEIGRASCRER